MIHESQSKPERTTTGFRARFPSPAFPPGKPREKFRGMLNRKERWGLSFKGKAVIAAIGLVTALVVFFGIHPFLAVTQRVDTRILVVEGWVHDFTIQAAVNEFRTGSYERVFTTGGPIEGQGGYINDAHTYASIGAGLLKEDGIPEESLQMAPSRVLARDRTYGSAVALRDWFREHNLSVQGINVVTEEAHARRTRLLFQEAFGKDVKVGIISSSNPDYDAKYWWRYSQGAREVIGEGIAYIYAKFLFWPPSPPQKTMSKSRNASGISQGGQNLRRLFRQKTEGMGAPGVFGFSNLMLCRTLERRMQGSEPGNCAFEPVKEGWIMRG